MKASALCMWAPAPGAADRVEWEVSAKRNKGIMGFFKTRPSNIPSFQYSQLAKGEKENE
jgi:hypothetical protein